VNSSDQSLPILVIGFQRVNPLEEILTTCLRETTSVVYVSIDGGTPRSQFRVAETHRLVERLSSLNPGRIRYRFLTKNFGSAVNVISSVDWFFSQNDYGVILEDDCIPHVDFFVYAAEALKFIMEDPNVWFFSGFRPQIKVLELSNYSLCQLPLNWGWGTTAAKWHEIRGLLLAQNSENLICSFFQGPRMVYWNVGFRRSLLGWVDTWDTAIAYLMVKNRKFTLMPNTNLICNVGNDSFASNTKKETAFLNSRVGNWDKSKIGKIQSNSQDIDSGLSKDMIGIKWRHILSPIIRFQMQRFFKLHKSLGELESRLENFSNHQIVR
jgi:hypothetical protein